MDRLHFNEEEQCLIDIGTGRKFEGKRISDVVSTGCRDRYATRYEAEEEALKNLLADGTRREADAYEIISSFLHNSNVDYEQRPLTATVYGIFYIRE